jgi:hypothetical protein
MTTSEFQEGVRHKMLPQHDINDIMAAKKTIKLFIEVNGETLIEEFDATGGCIIVHERPDGKVGQRFIGDNNLRPTAVISLAEDINDENPFKGRLLLLELVNRITGKR